MISQQIDNSRLSAKVDMRRSLAKDGMTVLDCYHGNGVIWSKIAQEVKIRVIGIEVKKGKGPIAIYGKAEKVIPSLDLSKYDIIDFDSYGSPYEAMKKMFENKSLKSGTICFYTYIQTGYGNVGKKLLSYIGITDNMYKRCPTLYSNKGFESFKQFLFANGIKKIYNIYYKDIGSRKNYGYFIV